MTNESPDPVLDKSQEKSLNPIKMVTNFFKWMKDSLSEAIVTQAEIPETSVQVYMDSISQLRNISAIARTIDDVKFSSREFMAFVRINSQVKNNKGEYEGLESSIDLLRVAFETKDCFAKIEATESRFHSYSQQEYYDYTMELLENDTDKEEFKKLVQEELIKIIPKVKSEEGQTALQSYLNQLEILSEDQLGLKLLYLFKQSDLSNFALLRNVGKIADTFYDKKLDDLRDFILIVQVKSESFLKLGEIIQIPKEKNNPDTYALILQYIALNNRYQKSFAQFQQLLLLLKDWQKFFVPIETLFRQYPEDEYKYPKVLKQEIPGLDLYNKYKEQIDQE